MRKVGERLHPKQFAAIESKLARADVIDQARIAEIRREILDGCFQVSSEVVANRLLALAKEMLTGKNIASAAGVGRNRLLAVAKQMLPARWNCQLALRVRP